MEPSATNNAIQRKGASKLHIQKKLRYQWITIHSFVCLWLRPYMGIITSATDFLYLLRYWLTNIGRYNRLRGATLWRSDRSINSDNWWHTVHTHSLFTLSPWRVTKPSVIRVDNAPRSCHQAKDPEVSYWYRGRNRTDTNSSLKPILTSIRWTSAVLCFLNSSNSYHFHTQISIPANCNSN